MDRFWTKSYPPGMPHAINVTKYAHIADAMNQACDRYPESPAFTSFNAHMTYAELKQQAYTLAAAWQGLGLKPGERIAVMLPNCLQYPVALHAAFLAGLVVVNVNPMYKKDELLHQLKDADVSAVVVLDIFMAQLLRALPGLSIRMVFSTKLGDNIGGVRGSVISYLSAFQRRGKRSFPSHWSGKLLDWPMLLKLGKKNTLKPVPVGLDDLAFLQYTSATTGLAKGAMLTHRNILANMTQAKAWVKRVLEPGKEVLLLTLPMYHIFSLTVTCFCMTLGARSVLVADARRINRLTRLLQKESVTLFMGINTLFNALLADPGFQYANFSQLKLVIAGGMSTQQSVANRWKRVTGFDITEGYGLTEASPIVAINPVPIKRFKGSVGLPLPNTDLKIIDSRGITLPQGKEGEVCVRGPQITKGYWNNPEETKKVIDKDGWLHTGDIGRMDEQGFLYLVERKKDMILVSGFNVYPTEIEEVLVAHPSVSEAAVIGAEDGQGLEKVVAFIVLNPEKKFSGEEAIDHCRKHLAGYKVPKEVHVRQSLPKSNVGKILRRRLRDGLAVDNKKTHE